MTSAITTPRRFNRTEKLQPKGSQINIHHDVMGRHFVYTFFVHYFEISKVTVEFNIHESVIIRDSYLFLVQ